MKAKIYLSKERNMERYGLHFEKGVALSDNEYLINKLQAKGLKVEIENENVDINTLKVEELRKIAIEKGIEIPEKTAKKDIVKLINEDGEKEPENNDGEDSNEDGEKEPENNESIPQE